MTTLAFTIPGPPRGKGRPKGTRMEAQTDREWATALYGQFARGGGDERQLYVEIDGNPWSKSRPRFTKRGHAYKPRTDSAAEQALGWRLKAARREKFPGNVMLVCRFYRSNMQRIDTDNLLKHVCDSANGILWDDDSQVTLLVGEISMDAARPRTVILVGNHNSTLVRGADNSRSCERCHEAFKPRAGMGRAAHRFCSMRCNHAARTVVLASIPCRQCGKAFQPTTSAQALCSAECRGASLRDRNRLKAAPRSQCLDCGKTLGHTRGGRCRDCWRKDPKVHSGGQA